MSLFQSFSVLLPGIVTSKLWIKKLIDKEDITVLFNIIESNEAPWQSLKKQVKFRYL